MTTLQVQYLLAYLGYDPGAMDGVLGAQTKAATYDFQEAFGGLRVDGLPGAETQKALRHAVAYGMPDKPSTSGTPPDQTGTFWDSVKYFRREEFRCPCPRCGGFPVEPAERLVRVAVQIREHFGGKPVIVSSGVRCQAHNAELPGSSPTSRHMRGLAMDFAVRGVPVAQVLAYTQQLVAQGVSRYTYEMKGTGYVHIDVDE